LPETIALVVFSLTGTTIPLGKTYSACFVIGLILDCPPPELLPELELEEDEELDEPELEELGLDEELDCC
jgi:hypothetical protein